MAVRYLLDTNTCSYIIKGNRPHVRDYLMKVPLSDVGISAVTEAELRFGVVRLPEARKLALVVEEFLLRLEILPWASDEARLYARLRATLEREGHPLGNLDMMIAAQALAADALLVTSDRAFKRVNGLRIDNWTR